MKAREYLLNVQLDLARIEAKQQLKEHTQSMLDSATAKIGDGTQGGSYTRDKTLLALVELKQIDDELSTDIGTLTERISECSHILSLLKGPRLVLFFVARYLRRHSKGRIKNELGLTESQYQRTEKQLLSVVDDFLKTRGVPPTP